MEFEITKERILSIKEFLIKFFKNNLKFEKFIDIISDRLNWSEIFNIYIYKIIIKII